jgi:uncharacterized protein (TIGR02594 family)
MATRPTLRDGDYGADVGVVQQCLGIEADRDFGPMTESAVSDFQVANRIPADGVVNAETWAALEEDFPLPAYPPPLYALTASQVEEISQIARNSQIAGYSWKDRGVAPEGYINGMAVAFAIALLRHRNEEPIADEMARAAGHADEDALAWYADEFAALHMVNNKDGVMTLRHVYAFLIGLGMRESSGCYCEGRDMSADNVSSDTAEAGLFQMSWNASGCSTSMLALFDAYAEDDQAGDGGYEDVFNEGVTCSSDDWSNYGSGNGEKYQYMAKHLPLFAVETAAIGVRSLRQHWGPINRKEVELRQEADEMLMVVQAAVVGNWQPQPRPPQPVPDVPEWLLVMRAITGLTETPGSADNPKILAMPEMIGRIYPDMASYCALYQHDSTAWCGVTVAFCMSMTGVRPPFGPTDTDKWMWALAWGDVADATSFEKISEPRRGCVVVMSREGGGHVTLFEEMDGSNYLCRGGNQSDAVNVQSYSPSTVVALMWPKGGGPQPTPGDKPRVVVSVEPPGGAVVTVEGSA